MTYITKTVGCIYPIQIYVFKNVYYPTMRPKGAENLSNLHLSPKGWHDISNTNKYIQLIFILLIEYFPTLRPKGSQKLSKLHSSPRVCIIYSLNIIQYHHIFSTDYIFLKLYISQPRARRAHRNRKIFIPQPFPTIHSSCKGWHDISNTNIYIQLIV